MLVNAGCNQGVTYLLKSERCLCDTTMTGLYIGFHLGVTSDTDMLSISHTVITVNMKHEDACARTEAKILE